MTKSVTTSVPPLMALGAMLAVLCAAPAEALQRKVWVSGFGVDSPTCGPIATPCLTFQQAHDNVSPGGDIALLAPADFGLNMNISKAVTITNDGVGEAGFLPLFNQAIGILAGPGDVISLRGLVVDGQYGATSGIFVDQASAVHIQNCVIRNFQGSTFASGLSFVTLTNSQLFVSDTIIYNNGAGSLSNGVRISPSSNSSVNVVLDRVHVENNVIGILIEGGSGTGSGAHVVIRDSVVSGNVSHGIFVRTDPGKAPAFVVVEHTSVVNNGGTGILANGPRATVLLNDNTITRNGTGISAVNGGQLISYGNNKNNNNVGPEGAPTGFYSQM